MKAQKDCKGNDEEGELSSGEDGVEMSGDDDEPSEADHFHSTQSNKNHRFKKRVR